jgi:hypothetical protein
LLATADAMLLPALRLAEHDHERGAIDAERRNEIVEQVATLIEDLPADPKAESDAGQRRLAVLCLPAADRADEVAALIVARAVAAEGIDAEVLPAASLRGEMLERVARTQADALFVSAVPPAAVMAARYMCKKLNARSPLPIFVGLWDAQGDVQRAGDRLRAAGAARVALRAAEVQADLPASRSSAGRTGDAPPGVILLAERPRMLRVCAGRCPIHRSLGPAGARVTAAGRRPDASKPAAGCVAAVGPLPGAPPLILVRRGLADARGSRDSPDC